MKKFILMAAVMLSSMTAFAQTSQGSLTVQPKLGLNIATLTKAEGADPRFGLAVGAEFEYGATDMVGISFGALYSMQGCKNEGLTAKLDYQHSNPRQRVCGSRLCSEARYPAGIQCELQNLRRRMVGKQQHVRCRCKNR